MPEPMPLPASDGPVRLALLLQSYGQGPDARWEEWVHVVRLAEQAGFAGVHVVDHLYMQTERIYGPRVIEGQPGILECWTTLAALAAVTGRMWVGPLVSPVALRHPVLIAKQAATVDRVSGGRLLPHQGGRLGLSHRHRLRPGSHHRVLLPPGAHHGLRGPLAVRHPPHRRGLPRPYALAPHQPIHFGKGARNEETPDVLSRPSSDRGVLWCRTGPPRARRGALRPAPCAPDGGGRGALRTLLR